MKFTTRVFAAVAIATVGLCAAARAQVLDQVPAGAMAVLNINSLSSFNAKVVKLANTFGLDEMVPEFKDPLGAILDKTHMSAGVNKDGDMAMAFFPPPAVNNNDQAGGGAAGDDEPLVLTLVPTSDYKAFVGNFKDPKEDGQITSAGSPDDGKPLFITQWGNYAAVSSTRSLLEAKPTGFKLQGLAIQESLTKDVTLIANMDELRAVALPKLKAERGAILDELNKNIPADPNSQKLAPVARAVVNVYLDAVQDFIEQGTNGVVSLNLADDGISTAGLAEFKANSSFGSNLAKLKGSSTTSLLAGLPDRKYFAFGGYAADPKIAQMVFGNVVDPIAKELAAAGDEWKPVADLVSEIRDYLGSCESSASGYVVPTGPLGQESVLQTVSVTSGDAKAMQAAERKVITTLSDLAKNGPQSKDAPMAMDFKADAKSVDGVSFDHLQTNLSLDPNDPKAAQAQQALSLIYGPNGMSSDFGVVSDSKFVAIGGGSDQLLSDVIASAKAGEDHLSAQPGVAGVTARLPKNPVMEYYIALDNIVATASKYAVSFGLPVKINLPPNLPPIGLALVTDGPSVRLESFIPADLVQNLIAAGLQARQNMMQPAAAEPGPGGTN